ncbi:MAG: hypothetical protein E7337_10375 [Clostridiales bacterium]|nr:hypothetical protein [Clostridiales bacterium]
MLWLPELNRGNQTRTMTEVFGGYNRNLKINEGEWFDEKNLSSDHYPLFAERRKRGLYHTGADTIHGIIAKDALAWVEGGRLYYNGYPISGITLSEEEDMLPKQLVSMGAYLCIFPDNVYFNTQDHTDSGYMGARFTTAGEVTYTPARIDGTAYENIAEEKPESPANGDLWLDTSGDIHVLKQWSEATSMWVDVPTVYTRISYRGIGTNFKQYDGVSLSGMAGTDQIAALNGDVILQAVGEDYIVVIGLIDRAYTQENASVTIERKIPKLDFVCESGNRLWGCFYGMHEGKMLNQIFASKLGDFKNWNCFMGIAGDSYAVSVGSDGPFTGAITYLGYPTFFKENCIHKVYGSMPSSYQVQTNQVRGVQRGSEKSLAILNEILYYKSMTDICAYDGSLPTGISHQLGGVMYKNACAGAVNGRYMVSMQDMDGGWHMFAYDPIRGIWHREDDVQAVGFAHWGHELYFIDAGKNAVMTAFGTEGAPENNIHWYAESGLIGYEMPDRKYVSRFNLRMKLDRGASVSLAIEYDSSGMWQEQGTVTGAGTDAFVFPVIPRRCDHFRIRLEGRGGVRIYSLTKELEQGSDAG